ncbi:MAG: recombinase family protein [Deltaproteobacteria bacterium]|nr:recombinase family protein [Deltaproteobacteria bacterium]
MKRSAVGYIRVSLEEQARQGVSLDMQQAKIRAYCALNDLELLDIISDEGISAKTVKARPGIQTALDLVKSRKVSALVVYKLDRLARNAREALEIADLLKAKAVDLHSITEKIDTESAAGRLFYNILAAMAAWERETIAERTSAALRRKAEKLEYCGGEPPYGYRAVDGKLTPDIEEQRVLKKIRNLRTKGYTIRRITRCLAEDGCLNRRGKPFNKTQVARIIAADEKTHAA